MVLLQSDQPLSRLAGFRNTWITCGLRTNLMFTGIYPPERKSSFPSNQGNRGRTSANPAPPKPGTFRAELAHLTASRAKDPALRGPGNGMVMESRSCQSLAATKKRQSKENPKARRTMCIVRAGKEIPEAQLDPRLREYAVSDDPAKGTHASSLESPKPRNKVMRDRGRFAPRSVAG
jgi:hypothetical protein